MIYPHPKPVKAPKIRKALRRNKRLNPFNRARRVELYDRNYGKRGELVRAMDCLLAGFGCWGPVEAAHVKSRGAGGDRRSLVPLCSRHHQEQGRGIKTFCARYGLDLAAIAERIAAEFDRLVVP